VSFLSPVLLRYYSEQLQDNTKSLHRQLTVFAIDKYFTILYNTFTGKRTGRKPIEKEPQVLLAPRLTVSILSLPRKVSTMQILHPNMTDAKTLITSSDEAKAMGRWDAQRGGRCRPEAYTFAPDGHPANSIAGSRMSGDYTFAYITAKGL
jgi:hypothetical protein